MSMVDVKTSKAAIVYRWLREEFEAGRIAGGDRLPSENELCERFGASRPSVRQATARLAHEGLVRTERGRGTFRLPPRAASSRDAAFVLPRLTSYIYPEIIAAASRALSDRGYQTLFDCSDGGSEVERTILERLKERRPAALALSPIQRAPLPAKIAPIGARPAADATGEGTAAERAAADRTLALLRDIRAAGTAVLLLDNTLADTTFSSVVIDDYGAGRRAAEYLLDRGFTSPAIVWSDHHAPFHERRRGFADALAFRGIPLTSERELRLEASSPELRYEAMEPFVEGLLRSSGGAGRAVFCTNDELALVLRDAAHRRGLALPGDLSLVGFDDSPIARLSEVSLTSFAYPSRYIGERAAAILIEMVEGNAGFARTSISIEPVLVERGSVRARSMS
jgi:GntR family transcriptional regulator, arabinose operon transcriptional repressor